MIYVKDPRRWYFQPERRMAHTPPPTVERRVTDPIRITSEQYEFLRDCFVRREALRAKIGDRERRARHLLVLTAIAFAGLYFAAPDFSINLERLGVSQKITMLQVSAVAPLIIAYLVVEACIMGARRLRLNQECKVMDAELQRFGCETSYSILDRFRKVCTAGRGTWEQLVSQKYYHAIYILHDAFIVVSVLFACTGSAVIAIGTYTTLTGKHPHAAIGFFLYLLVAIFVSAAAPVVLISARRKKERALETYLAGQQGRDGKQATNPVACEN